MGCGTGVLAMAIARLWKRPVLAVDIDPISVAVTRQNALKNNLHHLIRAETSDGYAARIVRSRAPYDLIVANILARPLATMAPALTHGLRPSGIAVLSGILDSQQRAVINAHCRCGLRLLEYENREG